LGDTIAIRAFEPTETGYASMARLLTAVWPEQPASAAWLERFDADRESGDPIHREVAVHVRDPEIWLGIAECGPHRWSTDPGRFDLQVHVHPDHRRRGTGTILYDRAVAFAAGTARVLETSPRADRGHALRFLARRRFRLIDRSPVSELDLGRFDPGRWNAVIERVASSGVRLITLNELLEQGRGRLRELWELEREVQPDAPNQADTDLPPFERWRRAYEDNPDLRPDGHVIAVDCDRLVGMTQLWASQATDAILYTGFTGVRRGHRGGGVATALKARALSWAATLRTATGRRPVVRTSNEESNPMLVINTRLGFERRPAVVRFELDVRD